MVLVKYFELTTNLIIIELEYSNNKQIIKY